MRYYYLFLLMLACSCPQSGNTISTDSNSIVNVAGPTVVAFIDNDTLKTSAEVLEDFYYHFDHASDSLRKLGIATIKLDRKTFLVRENGKTAQFTPDIDKGSAGYYLAQPDKQSVVLYGVMTDIDLIDQATVYFGLEKGNSPR